MASPRALAAIVAGIIGILGLTVVIVVLAGQRAPVEFAPDSPEGAMQAYLRSWDAEDASATYAWFSSAVQERMDFAAYRAMVDDYRRYADADGIGRSVFVTGSRGSGDRVTVTLVVEEIMGQGLDLQTYRYGRTVGLVRQDGSWKVDEALIGLDQAPLEMTPY